MLWLEIVLSEKVRATCCALFTNSMIPHIAVVNTDLNMVILIDLLMSYRGGYYRRAIIYIKSIEGVVYEYSGEHIAYLGPCRLVTAFQSGTYG